MIRLMYLKNNEPIVELLYIPDNLRERLAQSPNQLSGSEDARFIRDIIAIDEYNRLLSWHELEPQLKTLQQAFATIRRRKLKQKRQRSQKPRSHTTNHSAPTSHLTKQDKRLADRATEQGVKTTYRFNDLYDSVWDKRHLSKHGNRRKSTGWKTKKVQHQWQIHQKGPYAK